MTLADYIKQPLIDVAKLAEAARVHRATVYRAANGEGCSRRTAAKIAEATKGAVTAAEILAEQKIPELATRPRTELRSVS